MSNMYRLCVNFYSINDLFSITDITSEETNYSISSGKHYILFILNLHISFIKIETDSYSSLLQLHIRPLYAERKSSEEHKCSQIYFGGRVEPLPGYWRRTFWRPGAICSAFCWWESWESQCRRAASRSSGPPCRRPPGCFCSPCGWKIRNLSSRRTGQAYLKQFEANECYWISVGLVKNIRQ